MLVSFSVTNFRSFREEQTFSLVASKRFAEDHPEHTVAIPGTDERVLRFGVLYGANGAGKSNLLKALGFLRSLALERQAPARVPFSLAPANEKPTVLDANLRQRRKAVSVRYGARQSNCAGGVAA